MNPEPQFPSYNTNQRMSGLWWRSLGENPECSSEHESRRTNRSNNAQLYSSGVCFNLTPYFLFAIAQRFERSHGGSKISIGVHLLDRTSKAVGIDAGRIRNTASKRVRSAFSKDSRNLT